MPQKNLHEGHRKRLRARAMAEGFDSFDPHQVLELLLFYVLAQQDTSEIAHLLINRFGSVRAVLNAPTSELVKIPGVGKKVAEWLHNVGNVVYTYCDVRTEDRPAIYNLRSALEFCASRREFYEENASYQICTAPSGTIQIFTKICDSLMWGDALVLTKSVREALAVRARNVFIVEYVDEDIPTLSEYDRLSAERYAETLDAIGAVLVDVIVVGREEVFSLYRFGLFDREHISDDRSFIALDYLHEGPRRYSIDDELPDDDSGL